MRGGLKIYFVDSGLGCFELSEPELVKKVQIGSRFTLQYIVNTTEGDNMLLTFNLKF